MGAAQGGQTRGTAAGAMTMPPQPGMTGAPANNPAQPPMQPMAGVGMQQPPSEPNAGGPMSPFNIESMLKTQRPGGGPGAGGGMGMEMPGLAPPPMDGQQPARRPLQPWGEAGKTSSGEASYGQPGGTSEGAAGASAGAGAGMDMGDAGGQMSPMVMLRLLKTLGRI